ncbi:AlbA family DNA-binding domain-containing protein [Nonomuraea polychroma]|uniref:AlbA family DNA-binding domain-containing protein n=1 Tax=Nonomuraea polychroma TaxID=46176 RepID=UPI003D920EC4
MPSSPQRPNCGRNVRPHLYIRCATPATLPVEETSSNMTFRSARLTALFGAPPEAVTYEQLDALTTNDAAGEAEDLDYKLKYDSGNEGADDIAVDIATFANHRGGVIVVGMAEANARPAKSAGVDLTDGLKRRIMSVAAERIFPKPQFNLREVPEPGQNGKIPHGLLLIIIPPSRTAPHAVVNPNSKDKLAYPRRHGSQKIWLTESEIAAAYRERFASSADRTTRLDSITKQAAWAMAGQYDSDLPTPLLLVSLVPDIPGELIIDGDSYRAFQHHAGRQLVLVGSDGGAEMTNTSVGPQRLICAGGTREYGSRAELHTDGSGTLAVNLKKEIRNGTDPHVWDSQIVIWIASALRYLARHARDRTGAAGVATTKATLTADVHHLTHELSGGQGALTIVTVSRFGSGNRVYGGEAQTYAAGRDSFILDDLADDGQPLASATARLASDLFQSFNAVEIRQISRDGVLQQHAWGSEWSFARRWASEVGIPVNDTSDPGQR